MKRFKEPFFPRLHQKRYTEQNAKRSRLSAPRACASVPALAASRHAETPLAVHRLVSSRSIVSSVGAAGPGRMLRSGTDGRETRVEDCQCSVTNQLDKMQVWHCPFALPGPPKSQRGRRSSRGTALQSTAIS